MKARMDPTKMLANLKKVSQQFPDRAASAIYREAQIEMTEAKRRTPVDVTEHAPHPGQLRASGRVHDPERQGRKIWVTLSFGGAAVNYAVWVHEILENFHKVGQAKYLESVLNESRSTMLGRIARRVHLSKMRLA